MTNAKSIPVNTSLDDAKFNSFHLTVIIALGALFVIDGYDLSVYGGTVPLLLKAFHMGPAYAGVVGGYSLMGAAVGALGLGSLADKIGRKYTILFCFSLFCVVMFLTGLTNGPILFGICRVLTGFGIGGTMPNIVALASEYIPLRNRAWGIAALSSGMPLGSCVGPAIGMWLLPLYGWRSVYFVGVLPILLLPLVFRFIPESPIHLIKKNQIAKLSLYFHKACPTQILSADSTFEVSKVAGKARAPFIELFREHRALTTVFFWVVYFSLFFQVYGMGVWMPKMMMNKGFSLKSGLLLLLIYNAGAFCSTHIGGWVANHVGQKPTIVVSGLIAFIGLALLAYSNGFVILLILSLVAGAGNSAAMNVAHGYVSAYYPQAARSTAMGFAWGVGRLGAILGPVMAGVLLGWGTPNSTIFMIIACAGIVVAILFSLTQSKYSFTYVSHQAAAKQAELTQV